MSRRVHINEGQAAMLSEKRGEVSFLSFFDDMRDFLVGLLTDPIGARPSEMLSLHGLDNDTLRKMLCDRNVVIKSEKFDEPYDETKGKRVSRYHLSYKVPRKNLKRKLRRIFQSVFD